MLGVVRKNYKISSDIRMYPEAFRPNSFCKTKIYRVDLIHSEIAQTYHTNQLRSQDKETFRYNVSVFFQYKNQCQVREIGYQRYSTRARCPSISVMD